MTGSLKITHDAWKKTKDRETKKDKVPAELKDQFQDAMKCNEQIEAHLTKARCSLPAVQMQAFLSRCFPMQCMLVKPALLVQKYLNCVGLM